MDNLLDTNLVSKGLELDDNAIYHLDETRKWTNFISVLGLICMGLLVIAFIFIALAGGVMSGTPYAGFAVIPMIIIATVYFFPLYYLLKFSSLSKQAIRTKDSVILSNGLKFLKLHYRYMGILMIIIIALYIIIIIIAALAGTLFSNSF